MRPKLPATSVRLALLTAALTIGIASVRPAASPTASAVPTDADARTITHVLNRIGFGARPGDIERVQKMGLQAYIDSQLNPDRLPDDAVNARLAELPTMSMSTHDLASNYFIPARELRVKSQQNQGKAAPKAAQADAMDPSMAGAQAPPVNAQAAAAAALSPEARMAAQKAQGVISDLMEQKLVRATMSDRQLDEVLTDFWFNHFNVYLQKGEPERIYITEYERDVIRPHVLGKFRDLLGATAHSPAMMFYLDNYQSVDPQAAARFTGRGPLVQQMMRGRALTPQQQQAQANMPKGLNENYGRELMELHTLGVDGGYTQQDVINVARAFTGWSINQPQQGGDFAFHPQLHDTREKLILGQTFPAGHGEDEGERVLDILAASPQTAHHIAYQLSQRFVADEPPAALVDRAAKKFLDTKGDLKEVTRLIITSPEFFAADAYNAKVKSPFEFVVSAVRATGATITNVRPFINTLANLGMPLYGKQPPTGYSNTSEEWTNTGALLNRMNFALQIVAPQAQQGPAGRAGRPGGPPPVRPLAPNGVRALGQGPQQPQAPAVLIDVPALVPELSDAAREHLIATMLAGDASAATRQTLAKAQSPQALIALTLGSPEFQKR